MRLSIKRVIYFHMFICAALLVFNLLYITRSKRTKRNRVDRARRWERELVEPPDARRREKLFARLRSTEELMAFQEVLEARSKTRPEEVAAFFRENRPAINTLAMDYGKKPAMERALFAYVIASYHPAVGGARDTLVVSFQDS